MTHTQRELPVQPVTAHQGPGAGPAGSFPRAWTLFRLGDLPVRLDPSGLVLVGLVGYFLTRLLAAALSGSGPWVIGGAVTSGALLFVASLLVHELGHAVSSRDRGIRVVAVTLFLMGGVTESADQARSPRHELVIVGIGPFLSLVLAAAFGLVATGLEAVRPVAFVAGYLGWGNLVLAVFNVLPVYPLDGGRLLRALLWALTGRRYASIRWAAYVGLVGAVAVAGWGAWILATGRAAGLWEILVGVALFQGAAQAMRGSRDRERRSELAAAAVEQGA